MTSEKLARKRTPQGKSRAARATAAKPIRRPQAVRTADTRAKVIKAAITCLYRTGYSATTITTVAEEARVSRGALTHQFPAKTDIMLAVVGAVFEEDSRFYNKTIDASAPHEWIIALPETMWRAISRPAGIAVMEIMLASRSDSELATKLRALQAGIDKNAHAWSGARIRAAGYKIPPNGDAIHEVFVAAVRGLALQSLFRNNSADVHRALRVLSDMMAHLYPLKKTIRGKRRS